MNKIITFLILIVGTFTVVISISFNSIFKLEEKLSFYKNEIEKVESKSTKLLERVSYLEDSIANFKIPFNSKIGDLEDRTTDLETTVDSLDSSTNDLENKASEWNNKIDSLFKRVDILTNELESFNNPSVAGNTKVNYRYTYYPSGKVKIKTPYRNGKKNGIELQYRENGNLNRKITFKDGKKHGDHIYYGKKGKIAGKVPFKDGKAHGIRVWYREDGSIARRERFINGKKQ